MCNGLRVEHQQTRIIAYNVIKQYCDGLYCDIMMSVDIRDIMMDRHYDQGSWCLSQRLNARTLQTEEPVSLKFTYELLLMSNHVYE